MAVFTTIPRTQITFEAPPPSEQSGEEYQFQIADGFELNIGSGYSLTIQSATVEIQYETIQKSRLAWISPSVDASTYKLDIGDGYTLDIGDGYSLSVSSTRGGTSWTTLNKTM